MDLTAAILTDHARDQLAARGLGEAALRAVLADPESIQPVRPGRVVAQAVTPDGYLLRVFVDTDRQPPDIVTAYRTSKLDKYRNPPQA